MAATKKKIDVQDHTAGSARHTELLKRYEEISEQIQRACAEIGARFYELGCAWKIVRDDRLWHAAGLKSFSDYIERKVHKGGSGPTKMTVYNCMKVAESLTREQAVRLGPTLSYAVAKDTEKVQREVQKLVSDGVSTSEVMAGLRQKRADEKSAKSKTREDAAELGLTVITGGQTEKVSVPKKEVESAVKRAEEKRRTAKARDVEKGTVKLEAVKGKKAVAGWAKAATIEVGGLTLAIEVNNRKGMLRYKTQ